MSEVDCPVDGCDYSGEANSVEAHISSSTDGEHSGKAGSEFRSDLQDGSTEEKEPDEPGADGPDETVTAEDLAETAEQDDENDLAAWLLVGGVLVVLFLFGGSSNSGAPANV